MDALQVIALIIVALIIIAVIIVYRKRIALTLKGWGFNLNLEAENESAENKAAEKPAEPPAGVRVEGVESTAGGLLIEEGKSATGSGIEVKDAKVKDDIVIGKGESGAPKTKPPA